MPSNRQAASLPQRPLGYTALSLHNLQPKQAFLRSCSRTTLHAYELARLNQASLVRKDVHLLLDVWVQNLADAKAARELLDLHDGEQGQAVSFGCTPEQQAKPLPPQKVSARDGGMTERGPHSLEKSCRLPLAAAPHSRPVVSVQERGSITQAESAGTAGQPSRALTGRPLRIGREFYLELVREAEARMA